MQFNVELSELAEKQYDNILSYIANVLKNPQALESVMDDFDDTIVKLEKMADAFGYCKSKRLKGWDYIRSDLKTTDIYLYIV